MSFGKSRAKIYAEKEKKISFLDVAGIDEAKDELRRSWSSQEPSKFQRLGGNPKASSWVGPPGTGKTLLARAVAGEANVPSSPSAARISWRCCRRGSGPRSGTFSPGPEQRTLHHLIRRKWTPWAKRGGSIPWVATTNRNRLSPGSGRDDGVESQHGRDHHAATNRPESWIPPAASRPFRPACGGDRPDLKGREEILQIHPKSVKLSSEWT